MKIMKLLELSVSVILISGCSSLSYAEPTDGPRARVRFVTSSEEVTALWGYDDKGCQSGEQELMRLRNGFLFNSEPKKLGMPLWSFHDNAAKEVYVSTEKTFHGMFKTGSMMNVCGAPFSFDFIEDQDYEVLFKYDREDCHLYIYKLEKNEDNDYVRVPEQPIDKDIGLL